MDHVPVLYGERVTLRPPRPEDVNDRLRYGRDAEFILMCGGDPHHTPPLTRAVAEQWYSDLCAEPLAWVLEVDGRCIGVARLREQPADRRARYAIGIHDPSTWNLGLGTEATRLVLRYAFTSLGLHRVDLRVLDINHRAVACYRKCGFVVEGVERDGALVAGRWQSDVMMSILEDEWRRADSG